MRRYSRFNPVLYATAVTLLCSTVQADQPISVKPVVDPHVGESAFKDIITKAANGDGRGGGDPWSVDAAGLRYRLAQGALKAAVLNYLSRLTEHLDDIADSRLKTIFLVLLENGAVQKDVATEGTYVSADRCEVHKARNHGKNEFLPASAQFGDYGGKVCFNIPKLVKAYRHLSREDAMIKLAALAVHEHVHHFQPVPLNEQERQLFEDDAFLVAGYVENTARTLKEPLLVWVDPREDGPRAKWGAFEMAANGEQLFTYEAAEALCTAHAARLPREDEIASAPKEVRSGPVFWAQEEVKTEQDETYEELGIYYGEPYAHRYVLGNIEDNPGERVGDVIGIAGTEWVGIAVDFCQEGKVIAFNRPCGVIARVRCVR